MNGQGLMLQRRGPIRCDGCLFSSVFRRTKGGCKSYVDAGHTSDKGKGRGSAVLANANPPAPPRPQPAKKAPSPPQPPKKHRVSPVYAKPKPSGAAPAPAAATADEEQRDLSPAPLLTPEPEVCNHNNNNVIVVGDEDDASCRSAPTEEPTHFKEEEPPRAAEDKGSAAVTFPMETPGARPAHQAAVGAGAQAHCSPAGQSVAKQRTDGTYSERRASAELEVRARGTPGGTGFRSGLIHPIQTDLAMRQRDMQYINYNYNWGI